MSHVIKQQRAYITRRSDLDNSMWLQDEAEIIALQNGDQAEATRRRNAKQDLKAKRRRAEIKPLPAAIIQALGKQDAISNMLKERELAERHGRTALHLRDYMVRREVHMGGSGTLVFVEGGKQSEMIDRIAALQQGERAVDAGQRTLPGENYIKPVTKLVCGHINIVQAGRLVGGRSGKAQSGVKAALRNYLEAAEPFFGRLA